MFDSRIKFHYIDNDGWTKQTEIIGKNLKKRKDLHNWYRLGSTFHAWYAILGFTLLHINLQTRCTTLYLKCGNNKHWLYKHWHSSLQMYKNVPMNPDEVN